MEGFIKEVHLYLWRNLYVGSGSGKEFTRIYGGIHISNSHISMAGGVHMKEEIHIRSSHVSMEGFI